MESPSPFVSAACAGFLQWLTDRFLRERLDAMECNGFVRSHLQGPLGLACWRWAAPQGAPGGCCGPGQEARARRVALLLACPRCPQALCTKTLAAVAPGMAVPAAGEGPMRSGPGGASGLTWPQDRSLLDLIGGGLPACGHVDKALSFVHWESYNAFVVPSDASLRHPTLSGTSRQESSTAKDKHDQVLVNTGINPGSSTPLPFDTDPRG